MSDDKPRSLIAATFEGEIRPSADCFRLNVRRQYASLQPRIAGLRATAAERIGASHWRAIRRHLKSQRSSVYLSNIRREVREPAATRKAEIHAGDLRLDSYASELIRALDQVILHLWRGNIGGLVYYWGRASAYGALLGTVEWENLGKLEAPGAQKRAEGARRGGLNSRKANPAKVRQAFRQALDDHPTFLVKQIYGTVAVRFGIDPRSVARIVKADEGISREIKEHKQRKLAARRATTT